MLIGAVILLQYKSAWGKRLIVPVCVKDWRVLYKRHVLACHASRLCLRKPCLVLCRNERQLLWLYTVEWLFKVHDVLASVPQLVLLSPHMIDPAHISVRYIPVGVLQLVCLLSVWENRLLARYIGCVDVLQLLVVILATREPCGQCSKAVVLEVAYKLHIPVQRVYACTLEVEMARLDDERVGILNPVDGCPLLHDYGHTSIQHLLHLAHEKVGHHVVLPVGL